MRYDGDYILADDEAKEIILSIYTKGYGLAAYMLERMIGTWLTPQIREDLIQDAFLRLIPYVEKLRPLSEGEQLAYMVKCVRTVAWEEGRRRAKTCNVGSLDAPDCPDIESPNLDPEQLYMMQEDITERTLNMKAAFARLSEKDQRLLIEKYQNGRSDAEIGALMGIKTRNVRVYIARARHRAAIYYGEEVDGRKKRKQSNATGAGENIVKEKKYEGL